MIGGGPCQRESDREGGRAGAAIEWGRAVSGGRERAGRGERKDLGRNRPNRGGERNSFSFFFSYFQFYFIFFFSIISFLFK
jgi:hypothetical protein